MKRYIDVEPLLKRIVSLEQLARKRVYDTPTNSPCYERYVAQMHDRQQMLSIIKAVPAADVIEVRHGYWEAEVKHFFDDYGDLNVYAKGHCSECGKDYPFDPTIAREYISRPENLIGYEHWDIDVEPIIKRVSHNAMTNKNLFPFCPNCGAKMDGERKDDGT